MGRTERNDIGPAIEPMGGPDVGTDEIRLEAVFHRAGDDLPTAEIFPVLQPAAARTGFI